MVSFATATAEQHKIKDYTGDLLVVRAGAGCAKTSSLELFAKNNPQLRMLYLVFGKANQLDAESRFRGTNVVSRTTHAIALARCGLNIRHKLTDNYRLTEIKQFLQLSDWGTAQVVSDVFQSYLISDARDINDLKYAPDDIKKYVKTLWDAARDERSPFPCKPDVYLKHYCLQAPEMHNWFQVILLDEAQDTNPVVADWVMRQSCRKLLVGDDHQQLFRFRGANNFLAEIITTHKPDVLHLTQSFRFGETVARVANAILRLKAQYYPGKDLTIKGFERLDGTIYTALPDDWPTLGYAALHRSVAGTIETALDNPLAKLYWIGGFERYRMQEVLDVYYLSIEQRDKIFRRKLLVEVKNITQYRKLAEQTKDADQRRILKMLDKHGSRLPALLAELKKRTVKDEASSTLVLGTLHACKGLEFERVLLADDWADVKEIFSVRRRGQLGDELNLLYVGGTRATQALVCNAPLLHILSRDTDTATLAIAPPKVSVSGSNGKGVARQASPRRLPSDAPRTFSKVTLKD